MPVSRPRLFHAALVALLFSAVPASAQTNYYWNAPNGGSGNWIQGPAIWATNPGGPVVQGWENDGTGIANFGNNAGTVSLSAFINVYGMNFTTGGYTISDSGGGIVFTTSAGSGAINTNGVNATVNTVLSGSVGLTKNGGGTLTLGSLNTYTGGTTINGGAISITADNILGAGNIVMNGGGLDAGASFTLSSGRGITINAGGGSLSAASGQTLTYAGAISGTGNLTILGAGTVSLTGANSYSGSTTLTSDTLRITADSNLGTAPGSATAGKLVFNGGTLSAASGFALNANRGISLNASGGTISVASSQILTYGGIIAGSGPLTLSGPGILSLGGANTYTGATNLNAGVLFAGAALTFSASSAVSVASGALLDLNSNSQVIASLAGAGNVALGSATLTAGGDNSSTTFSGTMSGAGGFTKQGSGTMILSGSNTYSGPTAVNGGVLSIAGDNNLGTAPGSATPGQLAFDNGTLLASTGFTLDSNRGVQLNAGGGTFSIGSSQTLSYGGVIAGSGGLTKAGAGMLTLSGNNSYSGTTTINGGTVLVTGQSGSNSGTGTGAVSVNNTATFGGTGRVAGDVTVNSGGNIRGGDATGVGTLTVGGNVVLNTGSLQSYRVTAAGNANPAGLGGSSLGSVPNPTNNNFVDIGGSLLPGGDPSTFHFTINATGVTFDGNSTYSYQVARVGTDAIGAFTLNDQSQFTPVGFTSTFNFSLVGDGSGGIFLNFSPVPEPTTVLGVAAGVMGFGGLIRRRRASRTLA